MLTLKEIKERVNRRPYSYTDHMYTRETYDYRLRQTVKNYLTYYEVEGDFVQDITEYLQPYPNLMNWVEKYVNLNTSPKNDVIQAVECGIYFQTGRFAE